MNRLFRKMIAVLLVITMAGANLSVIGMYSITYALTDEELAGQTTTTGNSNVEFNAYFEGGGHVKTENIDSTTAKLFVNIKVKNAGYLKNGVIRFENVNFKISEVIENSNIQSIDKENNQIILKQLNNGSDVTIEIPISVLDDEQVTLDNFSKEIKTSFSGTYIDGNGKEKSVSKEIINKLLWNGNAEVELETELTKYIPYAIGEQYGVMVQTKINSGIIDSKLPIKQTELNIQVPEINGTKPTSVKAIANHTKATNGASDGVDFTQDNYTYEASTGVVTINVSNNTNNIKWLKGVTDEYLITFLFEGQEIYNNVIANGVNTSSTVNASVEVYNSEETTISESTITMINANTKLGEIADFDVETKNDSISKGQVYANYEAQEKKEVAYEVCYIATVNSVELTSQVQFNQSIDKFLTSENTEGSTTVSGNNYVYNKTVKISEKMFQKILGEEGTIIIYDASQNELGTINKQTPKDSNENYVLDISSKNNNQLSIVTSRPIAEGQIVIEIEKAIKTNIVYSKNQMKSFTKMKVDLEGKASTSTVDKSSEMLLKEPTSVAEVSISRTDLTTVVKNENVEIRATLDTSSEYNALYKNPTLKIKLPSYISKIDIKNSDILMANGLSIKGTPKIVNDNGQRVINITLEGTQTEYTIDAEYKGAIIVLNTDLTVETLTPSNSNKMVMEWTNANDVSTNSSGTVETTLNFVAPTGTVTANGIDDLLSISDQSVTGEIEAYTDKRIATIYGKIINNYKNPIKNVVVLGRMPTQGNKNMDTGADLGSTFSASLNRNIVLSGIDSTKYTVYYSENVDATTDVSNSTNGWSTTATTNAKSYLIITNDYEMETGNVIDFSYNVEIPANLTHNNSTYEMYKVYYNNVSSIGTMAETKTSPIVGLTTGQGSELTVKVESNIQSAREGQIVRFTATIKNDGGLKGENVKLLITAPEGTVHTELQKGKSYYTDIDNKEKEILIGSIEPGQTITKDYELRIEKGAVTRIVTNAETGESYQTKENKYPGDKQIQNIVRITADNIDGEIKSESYTLNILEGDLTIENISKPIETTILKKGDKLQYKVDIENISNDKDLENVTLHATLPAGVKVNDIYYKKMGSAEELKDNITINGNNISVNVGELKSLRAYINSIIGSFDENNKPDIGTSNKISICTEAYIYMEFSIEDFKGEYDCIMTATADNTNTHYSNVQKLAAEEVKLKFTQKELDKKYIKEGTEYTYHFIAENIGDISSVSNKMKMTLPEGLSLVKAEYEISGKKETITYSDNGSFVVTFYELKPGETLNIDVTVKADLLPDKNDKEVITMATLEASGFEKIESNTVKAIIEYDATAHNKDDKNDENDPKPEIKNRYKITGTAWIDSNKNGQRDDDESILANVKVMLLNKSTNIIVKDIDNNEDKIATTDSTGKYQFDNLEKGEYIVIFVYDASRYSITEYQKEGVAETLNSDAITINMTIDGKRTIAGTTDVIKITNENARDIDIGLYSAEKFDLKLDKYISKITLTTPTIGTKTYDYDRSKIAKIEVLGSNLGKSNIVIEYKMVVTNEGAVAGYAKKIVDYLPEGVGFNTELNKDWYLSDNGNVYNASIANELIRPGESKEVTLIVTKKITEESLGTLNNNAEIYESYNEQGLKDMDSTPGNKVQDEDDLSQVDVVLSIVTGKIIGYTAISLGMIAILGFGIFEIKKRVLSKKKD